MTVAATSYEALVATYAINMLSHSANFQSLVGAGTAAAAQNYIVNTWGGTPGRTLAQDAAITAGGATIGTSTFPYALVSMKDPFTSSLEGVGFWTRRGTVDISLFQARQMTGELPQDSLNRAWNVAGLIRNDIEMLFGASSVYLASGEISMQGPFFGDESGIEAQCIITTLKLTWWA